MSFVLGSGSPRRRELLEPIVGADQLIVRVPTGDEAGFEGLHETESIGERLKQIVRTKMDNVRQQVSLDSEAATAPTGILAADTIVVVQDPAVGQAVLGKPNPDSWQKDVRDWMLRLYSGTTHEVWTGFQITAEGNTHDEIVITQVTFCELTSALVDWYLSTDESVGKAGGYAIQGAAASFVTAVQGSLTNVIGLPVLEVLQAFERLGIRQSDRGSQSNS